MANDMDDTTLLVKVIGSMDIVAIEGKCQFSCLTNNRNSCQKKLQKQENLSMS